MLLPEVQDGIVSSINKINKSFIISGFGKMVYTLEFVSTQSSTAPLFDLFVDWLFVALDHHNTVTMLTFSSVVSEVESQ